MQNLKWTQDLKEANLLEKLTKFQEQIKHCVSKGDWNLNQFQKEVTQYKN